MANSVSKNTALMTIASVGQKIVAFVYFTLIARYLGAEGTGKYFLALSFTTIFVVFVDLGLTNVLVREAAKVKQKAQEYFSTILSVKMLLGLLSYGGLVVAVSLLGYAADVRLLIYVSGITMLFDSLHLSMYGVLRALGNLKYESISIVASQLITLILGTYFLYQNFPLVFLILAFTIASALNVLFVSIVLYRKYSLSLRPKFHRDIFYKLGKIAIPFAIAAVFARMYSYADSIILSKFLNEEAVGLYSIPYKITYAFQFIPLALVAALYPRFSECYVTSKERLQFLFEQGIKYLLVVVTPITIGIGVLAHDIIHTVYTDAYLASILPLQILLIGLVFSYVSFPIGAFLNACNRQVTQTVIVGVVLIVNVVANILLIPLYGVAGAALAALCGNVILTIAGYIVAPRITSIRHSFFMKTLVQLAISGGVMGSIVWYVNSNVHFIYAIMVGALIYPLMLFATRTITKAQLAEAVQLIRR